jgi:hypothetical protein
VANFISPKTSRASRATNRHSLIRSPVSPPYPICVSKMPVWCSSLSTLVSDFWITPMVAGANPVTGSFACLEDVVRTRRRKLEEMGRSGRATCDPRPHESPRQSIVTFCQLRPRRHRCRRCKASVRICLPAPRRWGLCVSVSSDASPCPPLTAVVDESFVDARAGRSDARVATRYVK